MEHEQDDDAMLKDHSHPLQDLPAECLCGKSRAFRIEGGGGWGGKDACFINL